MKQYEIGYKMEVWGTMFINTNNITDAVRNIHKFHQKLQKSLRCKNILLLERFNTATLNFGKELKRNKIPEKGQICPLFLSCSGLIWKYKPKTLKQGEGE